MGDFSFSFKKPPGARPQPEQKNKFEAAENQFNAIRGCGLTPKPKVTLATLTNGQEPSAFEESPFSLMLALMGGADEKGEPFSDDVWSFPMKCIAEEGHYSYIISQFMRIAKSALPLEDLADTLDTENAQATITFNVDGQAAEWTVPVEEGMIDAAVLTGLAEIAASKGDGARFAYSDLGDQRLLVFLNEQDLNDLAETTGMEWAFIE
jgi:hypothetical protein